MDWADGTYPFRFCSCNCVVRSVQHRQHPCRPWLGKLCVPLCSAVKHGIRTARVSGNGPRSGHRRAGTRQVDRPVAWCQETKVLLAVDASASCSPLHGQPQHYAKGAPGLPSVPHTCLGVTCRPTACLPSPSRGGRSRRPRPGTALALFFAAKISAPT